jgi:hypothetical protein
LHLVTRISFGGSFDVATFLYQGWIIITHTMLGIPSAIGARRRCLQHRGSRVRCFLTCTRNNLSISSAQHICHVVFQFVNLDRCGIIIVAIVNNDTMANLEQTKESMTASHSGWDVLRCSTAHSSPCSSHCNHCHAANGPTQRCQCPGDPSGRGDPIPKAARMRCRLTPRYYPMPHRALF